MISKIFCHTNDTLSVSVFLEIAATELGQLRIRSLEQLFSKSPEVYREYLIARHVLTFCNNSIHRFGKHGPTVNLPSASGQRRFSTRFMESSAGSTGGPFR
jgi:hypothetical protein